jgi:hypothetical protein
LFYASRYLWQATLFLFLLCVVCGKPRCFCFLLRVVCITNAQGHKT